MNRKTPLKSDPSKTRAWLERSRGGLKKRSVKGRARDGIYRTQKKLFLFANPICQVGRCKSPSMDIHHTRGRVGRLLIAVEYFLAVCRPHHDRIHSEPAWARENGYLSSPTDWNVYPK